VKIKFSLVLFVVFGLFSSVRAQTVTFTDLDTSGTNTPGTSTASGSFTPTLGRFAYACIMQELGSATPNTPTMTGNGLTWTNIETLLQGTGNRITMFTAPITTSQTGTVTFDYSSQTQDSVAWTIGEATGSVVQDASNSCAACTSVTATLGTFASASNATFGCLGSSSNIVLTVGSGFTQIAQHSGTGTRMMSQQRSDNDTSVDGTGASNSILMMVGAEYTSDSAIDDYDDTQYLGWLEWIWSWLGPSSAEAATIYVDANLTSDCTSSSYSSANRNCTGSDGNAYNDFQEACSAATASDDITIRGGVYRRSGGYDCLLDATSGNHIIVTAQTCSANAPGCVQRLDDNWYENVVFDGGRITAETWTTTNSSNVYKATVNFWTTSAAWITDAVTLAGTNTTGGSPYAVANNASNYGFTNFAPGPYRLLTDGQPSRWLDWDYTLTTDQNTDRLSSLAGSHSYNKTTKILYVHARNNEDLRTSGTLIETWEDSDSWLRCRCDYVDFRGFVVRLWMLTWPLVNNDLTSYQTNVTYEGIVWVDNLSMIQDPRGMRFTEFAGEVTQTGATTYALRSAVSFRYSHFIRASREIFQFHGDDNVFQYNNVFDKTSQWSGGFDSFPGTNTRNNEASIIGENWFHGHIDSYRTAVIINTETTTEHDNVTENGNCQFNNQIFRGNLITEFQRSGSMIVGGVSSLDGHCALTNFDTTRNIFYNLNTSSNTDAIDIRSNLVGGSDFSRNLFYEKSGGDTIEMPSGSRAATLTNDLTFDRNLFYNQDTVFNARVCNATGVTLTNNLFNGNNSNGCTGTGSVTSAPTFVDVERLDFRPASAGSAQVITGDDIGPYNQGEATPTGMDFWTRRDDEAPSITAVTVNEGATSTIIVDFALGTPFFSFAPILAADGAVPTVAGDCAGLTFKKNGASNTVTDCEQSNPLQWTVTVTNAYACADTIQYSYDPDVGEITDSALPDELRLELPEVTDVSGSNLITTGCGGSPPDVPVFTLNEFRWKRVSGPASSTDWIDSLNTSITIASERRVRLTTQVVNTIAGGTFTPELRCNTAGGTYEKVTNDCSASAAAPFCFTALDGVSSGQDTSNLLTACGGTFVSGKVIQSVDTHPPVTLPLNGCVEIEWSLKTREDLVPQTHNPLRCRIYSSGTELPFALASDTFWAQAINPRSYTQGGVGFSGTNQ